jgi:hypothetical protein
MTNMHRRPELSIDHPDHLVTILAILFAERRDQKVIGVLEDARAKGELDTMLARLASSFSGSNSNRARRYVNYIVP